MTKHHDTPAAPPAEQILVHRPADAPVVALQRPGTPSPDPFHWAVRATLAPAPAGTRRVYLGGGL